MRFISLLTFLHYLVNFMTIKKIKKADTPKSTRELLAVKFDAVAKAETALAKAQIDFNAGTIDADTLAKKQTSLTSKKASLSKFEAENSFEAVSASLVLQATRLLETAALANGNILDSEKQIKCEFFGALEFVKAKLTASGFVGLWVDYLDSLNDNDTGEQLLTADYTAVIDWLGSKYAPSFDGALDYIYKLDKSGSENDISLHENLLAIPQTYALPTALLLPLKKLIEGLKLADVKRGDIIAPMLKDGEEVALPLKVVKSELKAAFERQKERVEAVEAAIVGAARFDERQGVFAGVNALNKAVASGLKSSKDKTSFLVDFVLDNQEKFLQAAIDSACKEAIEGKGNNTRCLEPLNKIVSRLLLEINPKNGESRLEYIFGGGDVVKYVCFVCPWLSYKKGEGFHEKSRSVCPATAHMGQARPVWRGGVEGDVVCFPPITLTQYLRVVKTVSRETRISNAGIKLYNSKLKQ